MPSVSIVFNDEVLQNTPELLITITAPNKVTYQREVYINEATEPITGFMASSIDIETGQY